MTNYSEVEILSVEDSPKDAELTIRALKERNLANRRHHVRDGAQALDFLFARGKYGDREPYRVPKLVILDLKLPKVSGLDVLRKLKTDPVTKAVPVVVMTSSKEDRDLQEAYRIGVNSYVVKPLEFDAFAQAVVNTGLFWMLVNHPPGALS